MNLGIKSLEIYMRTFLTALGDCAGYIHVEFFSVQSDHTESTIPQSVNRHKLPLV